MKNLFKKIINGIVNEGVDHKEAWQHPLNMTYTTVLELENLTPSCKIDKNCIVITDHLGPSDTNSQHVIHLRLPQPIKEGGGKNVNNNKNKKVNNNHRRN